MIEMEGRGNLFLLFCARFQNFPILVIFGTAANFGACQILRSCESWNRCQILEKLVKAAPAVKFSIWQLRRRQSNFKKLQKLEVPYTYTSPFIITKI